MEARTIFYMRKPGHPFENMSDSSKTAHLFKETISSDGPLGYLSRAYLSRKLRDLIHRSSLPIQEILKDSNHYLGLMPGVECSEAILYDLVQQIRDAMLSALNEIVDHNPMDAQRARFAFKMKLASYESTDPMILNRISQLEDPVAKIFLALVLRHKQKLLDFCRYMDERELNSISDLLRNLPDISSRLSAQEEQLLLNVDVNGRGNVVKGLFEMMLEINRATRGK